MDYLVSLVEKNLNNVWVVGIGSQVISYLVIYKSGGIFSKESKGLLRSAVKLLSIFFLILSTCYSVYSLIFLNQNSLLRVLFLLLLMVVFSFSKPTTAYYWQKFFKRGNNSLQDFTFNQTPENDQGCSSKLLPMVLGSRLKELKFTVSSDDKYWRAGFKVTSPNGNLQPLIDVSDGVLFHVGYNQSDRKNKAGTRGMSSTKDVSKIIDKSSSYEIEMFVDEDNTLNCIVNGENCFAQHISHTNLANVYISAWGDYQPEAPSIVNTFSVRFSKITYKTYTPFQKQRSIGAVRGI